MTLKKIKITLTTNKSSTQLTRLCFFLGLFLIVSIISSKAVLACGGTSATLWLGETIDEAANHNTSIVYVQKDMWFGWHIHWELSPPDESVEGFIWDTTEDFYRTTCGGGPSDRDDSGQASYLPGLTVGPHIIKAKIRKVGSESWYWSNPRTVVYVAVGKIMAYANGSWYDAIDDTFVVLEGTKYTFKAFPNPSTASWPSDQPSPSWQLNGNPLNPAGEDTKEITFDTQGRHSLRATCGSYDDGKTYTIEVIVPQIDEVAFVSASGAYQYDIYDGNDRWRKGRTDQNGEDDPGCFKKGNKTAVRVKFWHEKDLTFETSVKVWGDVDYWDEDTTGGNYPATDIVFGTSWPSPSGGHLIVSPSDSQDKIHRDSVDIEWEYKVPWGTNSGIDADGSYNLDYYMVWDANKCGAPKSGAGSFSDSDYTKDHIKDAIDWGLNVSGTDEKDLADKVCNTIHRGLVYSGPTPYSVSNCWGIHDIGSGDCGHLAAEMAYVMRCLGVEMFMSHANLKDVTSGLNDSAAGNGAGHCDTHDVDVKKVGDSLFTSNYWQGCSYRTVATPKRDTICWDPQHNKDRKKYWELGNDKSNPADAPSGRYGILYNYHWRRGGGGTIQQFLSGDNHSSCSLTISSEEHGN